MKEDTLRLIGGIALFLLIVLLVTDCVMGTNRYCPGTVVQHVYHPDYVSTDCDTDKNGRKTCTDTHHPAEYHLFVLCEEPRHVADVNTTVINYFLYRDGRQVTVGERIGRWSRMVRASWIERGQANQY